MGTSTSFGGQLNKTPLVPSWLDDDPGSDDASQNTPDSPSPKEDTKVPLPPVPIVHQDNRFTSARTSFTNYVNDGGRNTSSLRKSCNSYVNSSMGGSKNASKRMASSKLASSNFVSLFNRINTEGLNKTLEYYNIRDFIDKPIHDTLLKLADIACLQGIDGGSIDEDIARSAAMETCQYIMEQVEDVEQFEHFIQEVSQVNVVLEVFITNSIKERLILDIGNSLISKTKDIDEQKEIENHLDSFIRNKVESSMSTVLENKSFVSNVEIKTLIDSIYEKSYEFLGEVGE